MNYEWNYKPTASEVAHLLTSGTAQHVVENGTEMEVEYAGGVILRIEPAGHRATGLRYTIGAPRQVRA